MACRLGHRITVGEQCAHLRVDLCPRCGGRRGRPPRLPRPLRLRGTVLQLFDQPAALRRGFLRRWAVHQRQVWRRKPRQGLLRERALRDHGERRTRGQLLQPVVDMGDVEVRRRVHAACALPQAVQHLDALLVAELDEADVLVDALDAAGVLVDLQMLLLLLLLRQLPLAQLLLHVHEEPAFARRRRRERRRRGRGPLLRAIQRIDVERVVVRVITVGFSVAFGSERLVSRLVLRRALALELFAAQGVAHRGRLVVRAVQLPPVVDLRGCLQRCQQRLCDERIDVPPAPRGGG
mmetsp:Transcript_46142/g.142180  ORF Transcript_46142/g.142180 Transcript_46142/m.142180 type:complete len:293 (+) Transcript_46142:910-1788(+)